jgi:hypothetical protein
MHLAEGSTGRAKHHQLPLVRKFELVQGFPTISLHFDPFLSTCESFTPERKEKPPEHFGFVPWDGLPSGFARGLGRLLRPGSRLCKCIWEGATASVRNASCFTINGAAFKWAT